MIFAILLTKNYDDGEDNINLSDNIPFCTHHHNHRMEYTICTFKKILWDDDYDKDKDTEKKEGDDDEDMNNFTV